MFAASASIEKPARRMRATIQSCASFSFKKSTKTSAAWLDRYFFNRLLPGALPRCQKIRRTFFGSESRYLVNRSVAARSSEEEVFVSSSPPNSAQSRTTTSFSSAIIGGVMHAAMIASSVAARRKLTLNSGMTGGASFS